jgi:AcrR family transcriptional regulator
MVDHRVNRTRQLVSRALIALILEKDYGDITIKEIIDKAEVGRSTFYAHFLNKDTVLQYSMSALSRQMLEAQRAAMACGTADSGRILGFCQALFDHADRYRALYRAVTGKRSGKIVIMHLRVLLADLIWSDVKLLQKEGASDIPPDAAVQFAVGALLSMLIWWLETDSALTPSEANRMFRRLAVPALLQVSGTQAPPARLKAA